MYIILLQTSQIFRENDLQLISRNIFQKIVRIFKSAILPLQNSPKWISRKILKLPHCGRTNYSIFTLLVKILFLKRIVKIRMKKQFSEVCTSINLRKECISVLKKLEKKIAEWKFEKFSHSVKISRFSGESRSSKNVFFYHFRDCILLIR